MTHNIHTEGQPEGAWATAARRDDTGEFGIAVGHGDLHIGFIGETAIPAWLAAGATIEGHDDLIGIVADAAATLPKFKADLARRERMAGAAGNN